MSDIDSQPYRYPGPGRFDVNGVEWFACDPYPTWYRWCGGHLFTDPAPWADEQTNDEQPPDEPERCRSGWI